MTQVDAMDPTSALRFGDARDWFFAKRYGLFLHWGLYALPAWHEQLQWRGRVDRREYEKLAAEWSPHRFDPDLWLDLAQEAGMGYVCLTTKHHDGFCLWATRQTDFCVTHTPDGRDIVALLAEACQRRDFPLCLYYSCVDWHHPNYPNQGRHHELPGPLPGDQPDHARYLDFLRAQVEELCTNYGPLGGFWWDMNVEQHIDPSINARIRELQPGAVINNRGYDDGDFGTPERDWDGGLDGQLTLSRPTEACQSVGIESWGYRLGEDYYTHRHLQRSLAKYLARGANYLLNLGPRADGSLDPDQVGVLRRLGAWYHRVREALIDVEPASHYTANRDVLLTRRGRTIYVICHRELVTDAVKLGPLAVMPRRATLLNTGAEVACEVALLPSEHASQQPCLRLRRLPANELAGTVLVVRLEFDELPEATVAAVTDQRLAL